MADFLGSFFGNKSAPANDSSQVVIYDDGADDFVVVPADVAQRSGATPLQGLKPANVPKDATKRKVMVTDWKWARDERKQGRVPDYARAPSKSGGVIPKARRMVVVDDPSTGLVAVDADRAAGLGPEYVKYPLLKPESLPTNPTELAIATARVRSRRDADEETPDLPANVTRSVGAVDSVASKPAPRIDAPPAAPVAPAGLDKLSAMKAPKGLQSLTDAPAPTPTHVARPVAHPPTLDVSPVGAMPAPALPRPLTPPPMADEDRTALLALANAGRPKPVQAPQPVAAVPRAIPTPPVQAAPVVEEPEEAPDVVAPTALPVPAAPVRAAAAPRPAPEEDRPVAPPTPFTMPPARETAAPVPTRDFAALSAPLMAQAEGRWDESFSPEARVTPEDKAALLAFANGKAGNSLRAPSTAMGGDAMGTLTTSIPRPASESDLDERDAAALKALARAQRADDISAGIGALGDTFGQARDLILNRPLQPFRQRGNTAVQNEQARQELIAAQAKARRDNKLADATVAAKKNDAAKDEAALAAANAKAGKTAADAATAAALNDPKSPETDRVRQLAKQLLGQRVDDSVWDSMSGTEIKDVALKYGVPLSSAEAQAGLGARRIEQGINDQRDDNYFRRKRLELDEEEYNLAKSRLEEQKRQFGLTNDAKAAEHSQKLAERNVGGFTFDPKDPPSPDAAKKMADVSIARNRAFIAINNLRNLVKKHGTELTGPVSGQMATEWKVATDELRKIGDMGVPNGNDYVMLAMQLPNPTEVNDLQRSKSRDLSHYDTALQQLDRNVATAAQAYKYSMDGGGRTTPSASMPTGPDGSPTLDAGPKAPAPVRPALKTVGTSSQGIRTVSIPKEFKGGDLKAALAEGETVRYPIGGGKYQVSQKKDGKLLNLRIEDK